jgi:ABC-2 type transport system ATP-binding protein
MSTQAAPATGALVEAQALSVHYGRTRVLDDVSLAVPPGCVFALLGRNGSGKSSLLRVLLGERPPSAGRVRLLGEDPWTKRTALMAEVGVVPEEPGAPPEMTARQLSAFCARLHAQWDTAIVAERLARFEVPVDRPFGRLSKGQKGAVMLSLALGHHPRLLLLDDPTLGLDVVARDAVFREVIGELADRGTTVFVTTHELRAIEGIADQMAILHAGRLVLSGSLEALKAKCGKSLEQLFAAVAGTRAGDARAAEEVRA